MKSRFKDRVKAAKVVAAVLLAGVAFIGQAQSLKGLKKVSSTEIPSAKVTEVPASAINITTKNGQFIDATGRTLFLRGINLGGSSKVPYQPYMGSHVKEGFYSGTEVSFVGRPFPVEEADRHFERLSAWGFHFLRFLVTWEALEHEGPGIYDTAYIAYIKQIVTKANQYGINVLIDPHQDLWSRFTGGDGAPLWTFEVAGMDVTHFQETGAAFVHNVYGDPFPKMVWYTNYFKLGSATMFTLFFGGNDFAPKTKVNGQPIQDYLQEHYLNAMSALAQSLKGLPNVIGFEVMNEPSAGYIGLENISQPYNTDIMGDAPTPYEGMLLGAGIELFVRNYRMGAVSLKENKLRLLNSNKVSAWQNGNPCLWQQNGVWSLGADSMPMLNNAAYFSEVNGRKVDFNKMYYEPFAQKFAQKMGEVNPNWIICVDNVLFPYPQALPELKNIQGINWINGSHWYDDVTLVKKKYMPYLGLDNGKVVFGRKKVKKAFVANLANMVSETHRQYGNVPSLLGEFGIPFDMHQRKAYKTGRYSRQIKALNRSFEVAEANLLNYTLWNYTADNTNERGDLWNGEDLSVFSLSQQLEPADINSGGRALEAAIRPYPTKIAGVLTQYQYNHKQKTMQITIEVAPDSKFPTEIFVPEFVYGDNFNVYIEQGKLTFDSKRRRLMYYPEKEGRCTVVLTKSDQ